MLRACALDLEGSWETHLPLVEFAYNNNYQATIQMAPFEALYGKRCRSPICWDEVGVRKILGPELVEKSVEIVSRIKERIKMAQDRQKSYADNRRKDLHFEVGEKVFLRVAPMKGIIRFGKRGELRPRYIGPFDILEKVGDVAYRLALPPELSHVHNGFHVSTIRKYISDQDHIISFRDLELSRDLTYEEVPLTILGRKIHFLRNREIPLVLVQWSRHSREEATWEREDEVLAKYPDCLERMSK